MPNDAILLAADQLKFNWTLFRRFRAYLVGVAADNKGNIQITEYPGKHQILHRPASGRPHVWDFGFDGFMLYNKTGGLPDIVAYSLLIVRDRGQARKAGEVITKLMSANEGSLKALKVLATGTTPAAIALNVLIPTLNMIGKVLTDLQDKVLDTMQGSKKFSPAEKELSEIADRTMGSICQAEFQFNLFDGDEDDETVVDITEARRQLERDNVMISL